MSRRGAAAPLSRPCATWLTAVRLIDSSRIMLNSLSRDWAHYDASCDGVKLHIVADRIIHVRDRLRHTRKHLFKGRDLREIDVVIETGKSLRLVTNGLTSQAEVIADLHQTRFGGTPENAVRIQIAVAVIADLLLQMAQLLRRQSKAH